MYDSGKQLFGAFRMAKEDWCRPTYKLLRNVHEMKNAINATQYSKWKSKENLPAEEFGHGMCVDASAR